jgi:putative pyruvate formate lyase activating enzyme
LSLDEGISLCYESLSAGGFSFQQRESIEVTEPSYLKLHREGELENRLKKLQAMMDICELCPRACQARRVEGDEGICRTGARARVASYSPHFGEEAPLVGRYGSGTIFLSSCNLLCSFCQNFEISHQREGIEVTGDQLGNMMLQLADKGCHNINFVTPTHVIPQLLEGLIFAIKKGLHIPLVYNSGGYDRLETLMLLEGVFDIYMPDFKFWDGKISSIYCQGAQDYPAVAKEAIIEMHRQVGDLTLDKEGVATRGLLVRHLVMPGGLAGTAEVMRFLAEEISPQTYVNVMNQYRPCGRAHDDPPVHRRLTSQEYKEAREAAKRAGLSRLDGGSRIRLVFDL